jgi:hypothetical protein
MPIIPIKNKHKHVLDILKDEAQKARLQAFVDEAIKSKQKIQHEQDNIKALREQAIHDVGIRPDIFNQLVKMIHNNDGEAQTKKFEEYIEAYDQVMKEDAPITTTQRAIY